MGKYIVHCESYAINIITFIECLLLARLRSKHFHVFSQLYSSFVE